MVVCSTSWNLLWSGFTAFLYCKSSKVSRFIHLKVSVKRSAQSFPLFLFLIQTNMGQLQRLVRRWDYSVCSVRKVRLWIFLLWWILCEQMTQFMKYHSLVRLLWSKQKSSRIISALLITGIIQYYPVLGFWDLRDWSHLGEISSNWEAVCLRSNLCWKLHFCFCTFSCEHNLLFRAWILFCLSMMLWDQTTAMCSTCSYS